MEVRQRIKGIFGFTDSRDIPDDDKGCVVQLRNAIGAIVETRILPFTPKRVTMSQHQFAAVSDRCVYAWHFGIDSSRRLEDGSSDQISGGSSRGRERMFDIENLSFSSAQAPETFQKVDKPTKNPITALTVSDRFLIIGRKTGAITRYVLPHLSPEKSYQYRQNPIDLT